jgi:hypothetical protein
LQVFLRALALKDNWVAYRALALKDNWVAHRALALKGQRLAGPKGTRQPWRNR